MLLWRPDTCKLNPLSITTLKERRRRRLNINQHLNRSFYIQQNPCDECFEKLQKSTSPTAKSTTLHRTKWVLQNFPCSQKTKETRCVGKVEIGLQGEMNILAASGLWSVWILRRRIFGEDKDVQDMFLGEDSEDCGSLGGLSNTVAWMTMVLRDLDILLYHNGEKQRCLNQLRHSCIFPPRRCRNGLRSIKYWQAESSRSRSGRDDRVEAHTEASSRYIHSHCPEFVDGPDKSCILLRKTTEMFYICVDRSCLASHVLHAIVCLQP